MAAVESTMLELGIKAPDFTLPIVTGGFLTKSKYSKNSKGLVVAFICNHCPFVKHLNEALVQVANSYMQKGIAFIAVSSNDIENYPDDSPEKMVEVVRNEKYPFPYLYDETQEVARMYKASCTPDFFIFDQKQELIYRGRFDESRPSNGIKATGKDIKDALESLLKGEELATTQIPSIGCNIKWKPGNEPDYFG